MARLTTPEQITERMRQWYDPDWHMSLYRQMNYAFGEPWNKNYGMVAGDEFPDFGDITVKFQEIGRSRRIINNQLLTLARVMYADPEPEFPQVDKFTAEARKQFYMERYKGQGYGDGYWGSHHVSAFLDADGLGAGFVQLGLRTNRKTGYQHVHASFQPLLLTIWDRHARDPRHARGIIFCKYVALDIAEDIWGYKKVHSGNHIRKLNDNYESTDLDVVRVFEYYDLGYGLKGDPTMAVIPSDFGQEPWTREENSFECLPFSAMVSEIVPGQRRPIGRISRQMDNQEMLNQIEKQIKAISKKAGVDIVDMKYLSDEDVKRYNNGDTNILIRMKDAPPGTNPWIRIQAQEAAATLMEMKGSYERLMSESSGVNDFDRGTLSTEKRTATENQLLDKRSSEGGAMVERAAAQFHIMTCEKALHIAKGWDRDPITLDLFGINLPVNVPGNPNSFIDGFLEEPSRIVISPESLKAQDVKAKKAEELALYKEALGDLVGTTLDPITYTKAILEKVGEKDPDSWLLGGNMAQSMEGSMTPMQTQMGMPPTDNLAA